ncbi:hypothetical protein BDZ91DRAFT_766422 [Kalaharituber pfeilii]|nr:hypothetical protein BDZ91DRAFT_766422 [Kalaharituber pfeilii]
MCEAWGMSAWGCWDVGEGGCGRHERGGGGEEGEGEGRRWGVGRWGASGVGGPPSRRQAQRVLARRSANLRSQQSRAPETAVQSLQRCVHAAEPTDSGSAGERHSDDVRVRPCVLCGPAVAPRRKTCLGDPIAGRREVARTGRWTARHVLLSPAQTGASRIAYPPPPTHPDIFLFLTRHGAGQSPSSAADLFTTFGPGSPLAEGENRLCFWAQLGSVRATAIKK